MRIENLEPRKPGLLSMLRHFGQAEQNISQSAEFGFPLPAAIRNIPKTEVIEAGEGLSPIQKVELLKVMLNSLRAAWEKEIKPRIAQVRNAAPTSMKSGNDFFTEADVSSERRIRDMFLEAFGEKNIRIFGEEANAYLGNIDSRVGIRIDPVDGTESMKFSKTDWGIMVGVYEGTPENETQVMGAVYFPERDAFMLHVAGSGVFFGNESNGQIRKVEPVKPQDSLQNLMIHIWEHSDVTQRGNTTALRTELGNKKARLRSTASACGDVLEALMTQGNRAFIIDGDYNEVDFIPHTFLEQIGYKMYTWDGTHVRPEDPSLVNKKLVLVPPGKAGESILETLKSIS